MARELVKAIKNVGQNCVGDVFGVDPEEKPRDAKGNPIVGPTNLERLKALGAVVRASPEEAIERLTREEMTAHGYSKAEVESAFARLDADAKVKLASIEAGASQKKADALLGVTNGMSLEETQRRLSKMSPQEKVALAKRLDAEERRISELRKQAA